MGVDDGDAKTFEGTGALYAPQPGQGNPKSGKSIDEQGELYAPPSEARRKNAASGKLNPERAGFTPEPEPEPEPAAPAAEPGMIGEASKDVRAALTTMKDVVVDKLSSLHLPAEAIEAGRKSMENLIKEVSHTYDNAKGAVIATKDKIVASMTPAAKDTDQVTQDVEHNVLDSAEGKVPETHHSKAYRDVKASINSRL